jgi:hypothetical protein
MLFQILPWVSSRLVGRATSKLNVAARGNLARNCTELEVCVVEGANEGVARDPRETGAPCPYWSTWLPSATLGWNIHRMKVNFFFPTYQVSRGRFGTPTRLEPSAGMDFREKDAQLGR